MNLKKSLIALVVAGVAAINTVSAAWVPTGATDIDQTPQLQGQNARTLRLSARLTFKEKNVVNGHTVFRWSPLPGAPIQFRMVPSTGTEIRNATTDGNGVAAVTWEVPRFNHSRRVGYNATFEGGFYNGVRLNRATGGASIYVNN